MKTNILILQIIIQVKKGAKFLEVDFNDLFELFFLNNKLI